MAMQPTRSGSGNQRPPDNRRQQGGQSYGSQRYGAGAGGGSSPPPKLPEPETIIYFLDDKEEKFDPALMDSKAEEIGKALALQDELKPSQLRRYYDDVLNLRNRLEAKYRQTGGDREAIFELLRADFKMLKAKAAYARGRDKDMFPERLLKFFINHVHSVDTARKFDAFCHHFQAVVAFHRFYKPKD
jgi:CRISPR-associated protein Csm2